MKIIVLAGGLSTERDVSLSSALGICQTLLQKGHEVFLLDVYLGFVYEESRLMDVFALPGHGLEIVQGIRTTEPDIEAVKASRAGDLSSFFGPNVVKLCQLADITFISLHGGEGENGKLQAAFDLLGIKYTGSGYLGCAAAMDKELTKKIFRQSGVDTPKGYSLKKGDTDTSPAHFGCSFPVVVKPCCGGSSIGVYIAKTKEEYSQALKNSFRYEDQVIVEAFVKGREFSCGIVGDRAYPPIEIIPKKGFFDYANKYQAGATTEICPAPISAEMSKRIQDLTRKACQALKVTVYGRADFILGNDGVLYCLEMNTLPGMTATSLLPKEAKAVGIGYGDLCELIIQKSLEQRYRYTKRQSP